MSTAFGPAELRSFRTDRLRMSRKELAEALGYTAASIQRWENITPVGLSMKMRSPLALEMALLELERRTLGVIVVTGGWDIEVGTVALAD